MRTLIFTVAVAPLALLFVWAATAPPEPPAPSAMNFVAGRAP